MTSWKRIPSTGLFRGPGTKRRSGPFYLRILWVGRFQMDVPRSANTALLTLRQLCSALTSIPTRLTTELRILRATFLVFQDPPAAYLLAYDSTLSSSLSAALNFTAQDQYAGLPENLAVTNDQYGWTLAYVPFAASNANSGVLINAAGSICTFYNATHEVRTHFFNGTQETQVSVVEFGAPLNTTYKARFDLYTAGGDLTGSTVGVEGVSFAPGVGAQVHALAMADAINDRLIGSINRNGNTGILDTTDTLIAETNIFDQIDGFSTGNPFPGLNVSSGIANVSRALQDLVANATVGFIHLNIGFDTVTASVPSSDTVYVLKRSTLAITYLLSFSILILISPRACSR
ncbi:hypothetical protein K438DRAFT_1210204 [Mycena galopus ATCC 62051]|nr:hypothetical protein K438DRAFT_1210204 [Mycena galopus ATCC 62051]